MAQALSDIGEAMALTDRVAIVTGGSRGIGRAIALRFARDGAKVAVNCARDRDQAADVARRIRKGGGAAIVIQADVSERAGAGRLVDETIAAFGRVDILVSDTGAIAGEPFIGSIGEDWASSYLRASLYGFLNACRAVLPHMIGRRYGRIVAIGPIIAGKYDFGRDRMSLRAASKGGVVAALRPVAAEVAEFGVTVNAVSPGGIAAGAMEGIGEERGPAVMAMIPMRRYGKPEEIAAAAAFLASEGAGYITGQTLRVNGGMAMG